MNRAIRRVGLIFLLLFGLLIFYYSYIAVLRYESFQDDPLNTRQEKRLFSRPLGDILTADGKIVARSQLSKGIYYRSYTDGPVYKDVVGYNTSLFGSAGLEDRYKDVLSGYRKKDPGPYGSGLLRREPNDLVLTIDSRLQKAAFKALAGQKGSVVMIDVRTGEILALVSLPSFDPSLFSDPNGVDSEKYFNELRVSPAKPFVNRPYSELYPPGSVFKIVTLSAALHSGSYDKDSRFSDQGALSLPLTSKKISNFGRKSYGNITLTRSFEVSANTTFAKIGMELGANRLADEASNFGFNRDLRFELAHAKSNFPDANALDPPGTALSAIGQKDVRVTPLHMALISAAVANQGRAISPSLVKWIISKEGIKINGAIKQAQSSQAIQPDIASQLTEMMIGVVENGTGKRAAISNIVVAGKTGTAETVKGASPHAWFTGFAPAGSPVVAIAVLIENGGSIGSEATGGSVAAPIAKAVFETYFKEIQR